MFKNLREFVESKLNRSLSVRYETINIEYDLKRIELLEYDSGCDCDCEYKIIGT